MAKSKYENLPAGVHTASTRFKIWFRKAKFRLRKSPLLLCIIPLLGTCLFIILIFVLTFVAKSSSSDSRISHDFISINPIVTDGRPDGGLTRWLQDFSRTVEPRNCHSHNDYWRPYPLFSALASGCSSVEADVFLTEDGTELLVGHDQSTLSNDWTLTSLYIDPLMQILDAMNTGTDASDLGGVIPFTQARGVFRTWPLATLVILIVKTDPQKTWPVVLAKLSILRERGYLTYFSHAKHSPGPITVVGTGNVASNPEDFFNFRVYPDRSFEQYHDTVLDAPLADLSADPGQPWNNTNAYYASAPFSEAIGSVVTGFSTSQLATLRAQIKMAQDLGLRARYWDTPSWPVGYRDYVWSVLEQEGVGVLNVDDLESAAREARSQGAGWTRDVVWMIVLSVLVLCVTVLVTVVKWCSSRRRRPVDEDSASCERGTPLLVYSQDLGRLRVVDLSVNFDNSLR